MTVRRFDGIDDTVIAAAGASIPSAGGALTILCLWRPLAVKAGGLIRSLDGGGNTAYGINPFSDGNVYFSNGSFSSIPYAVANNWLITGFGKNAGNDGAPTAHRYQFDTDTWTHPTLGALTSNLTVPTENRFGWFAGTEFGQLDLAAIAIWTSKLSNSAVDGLKSSLAAWKALNPARLWVFTQASIATPVVDVMGSGADQTSIVGTTVINGSDPPNFSLSLGVTVTGSAGVTLNGPDAAATGTVTHLGDATVQLGGFTAVALGRRIAVGHAAINLGQLATSASAITGGPVILPDDMYRPGPCRPYEFVSFCQIPLEAVAVSGYAVGAASEILYFASGQRFDTCQVTIRPCRKECYGDAWPRLTGGWWELGSGPWPARINGAWYNIACGTCGTSCSCSVVSETLLPGPVREIAQVTVDGVVLEEGTDYRLDDYRKLVRLGGQWPLCNDLTKGVTAVGTWSVTAIYGEPLPDLGKLAMGELVCQIVNDIVGDSCSLPDNVTDVTRQGLSFTLDDVNEMVKSGFDELKYVNKFIQRFNPHKLDARPRLYDIDGPEFRVTETRID